MLLAGCLGVRADAYSGPRQAFVLARPHGWVELEVHDPAPRAWEPAPPDDALETTASAGAVGKDGAPRPAGPRGTIAEATGTGARGGTLAPGRVVDDSGAAGDAAGREPGDGERGVAVPEPALEDTGDPGPGSQSCEPRSACVPLVVTRACFVRVWNGAELLASETVVPVVGPTGFEARTGVRFPVPAGETVLRVDYANCRWSAGRDRGTSAPVAFALPAGHVARVAFDGDRARILSVAVDEAASLGSIAARLGRLEALEREAARERAESWLGL